MTPKPPHGGFRPGSGRRPNALPSRRLVIHATVAEYLAILAIPPRRRAEILLAAIKEEEGKKE